MVRQMRIVCAVLCVLALLTAVPCRPSAATVYDGAISSTYVEMFRGVAAKLPPTVEYVLFRSGQYEYHLVAGELSYADGIITGTDVTVYSVTTAGTYSSGYEFVNYELDQFSLAPGTALVYSSLGPWPQLLSAENSSSLAVVFALGVLTLMSLLREIFRWTYRTRGNVNA